MKKLLTILMFLFVSWTIKATEYYVATPANGGKDTNTGLIGSPWATLNYASLHVPAGSNTIHVGAGVFNEGINRMKFAEGVILVGQGITLTEVVSSYVGDSLTLGSLVFSSPTQGTNGNQNISKIWFDGSSITANSAILVERRSNVVINNCKFTNFKYNAITMIGGADIMTEPTTYATGNQIYNDSINNCTGYYGSATRGAIEIVGQSGIKIYNNYFNQKQRVVGIEALIQGVSTFNKLMDVHDNYANKLLLTNVVTPTDFHLQATSPAIGAGTPTAVLITTDAGGNPIKNPPSIGAYEYYAVIPTVTTVGISNISYTTATSGRLFVADGGSNIVTSGICWNTTGNPTISDSNTNDGPLSTFGILPGPSNMVGLAQGTLYHVRAYATNATGTGYGSDLTFTTLSNVIPPTVTTTVITNILQNTATGGGNVTSDGGATVIQRGVCWDMSGFPALDNTHTSNGTGTGVFTSNITGLNPSTTYYVKAYAINGIDTAYGARVQFTTLPNIPIVTTTIITAITQTTALSGGNVTADGGSPVTSRGVCWAVNVNPTINNSRTIDGSGTGLFISQITSLLSNTTYHVRAYATNLGGTAYGNDIIFTTLVTPVLPTITTSSVGNVSPTTAVSGGNITADGGAPVTVRGVCWAITANPTIANSTTSDGSGTGTYISSMTGLLPNTFYHVRAYATNSAGTGYGNELTFTTLVVPVLPTVTTNQVTNITQTTATGGGNVTSDGGVTVMRGICWSTFVNPTINDSNMSDGNGTGIYSLNMSTLTPSTLYHLRAYATNAAGTAYGADVTFTTLTVPTIPTVTTTIVTAITQTTAISGGNVTADGGNMVTVRGVCWALTPNPTTSDFITSNGSGTGSYISSMTGLLPNTLYHVRAYAVNSIGTAYGNDITFLTLSNPIVPPTVTTTIITAITQTTAISGGNVTTDGGASVISKGVCWAIIPNPTIVNSTTNDGSGTGIYVSSIGGLIPGTQYHVRAYATNSSGTGYGNDISFTTLGSPVIPPTVFTSSVTNIAKTTATSGGTVSVDGGAPVTARGACWALTPNPTTANFTTFNGTGIGLYVSNMTGLTKSTNYHVRAYATNSSGTGYGVDVPFRTDDVPTVVTAATTNKLQTSVTSGGNVTNDDSLAVTAKGVCWSKTINPTVDSLHTVDGSGLGPYVSQITGLTPNTRYHVRAYAINAAGAGYGADYLFTTAATPVVVPTVLTSVSQNIIWTAQFVYGGTSGSSIKLMCTGNITDTGGSPITAKGICWGTSPNPTLSNHYVNNTSPNTGTGTFTANINSLSPNTLYHIRAFAKNAAGTAYGNDITVTTPNYMIQGN